MLGLHALLQVGQRAGGGLLLGLLLAGSFAFAYELAVQPAFDAVEAAVVGAGGAGVAVFGKRAAAGLGDSCRRVLASASSSWERPSPASSMGSSMRWMTFAAAGRPA